MRYNAGLMALAALAPGAVAGPSAEGDMELKRRADREPTPKPNPPTDPIRETRQMRRARERRERKSQ